MKKNNYNQCTKCLTRFSLSSNSCYNCHNNKFVTYQNKQVIFNGRAYNKKEWNARISEFEIIDNQVKLKYIRRPIHPNYIEAYFIRNVKSSTFTALILPMIMFSLLSVVIIMFGKQIECNKMYFNTYLFVIFLGILFGFFALLLFVMIVFKRYACYLTFNDSYQFYYKRIKQDDLDKKITNLQNIISNSKEGINNERNSSNIININN